MNTYYTKENNGDIFVYADPQDEVLIGWVHQHVNGEVTATRHDNHRVVYRGQGHYAALETLILS